MKREDKRARFAGEIAWWYDGLAHFGAINVVGLTVIAGSLGRQTGARWWQPAFVAGVFVFANFVEWWVHSGPMHHSTRGLRELYQRHAAEHHVFFTDEDMEFRHPKELKMVLFPPLFFPFLLAITSPVPLVLSYFLPELGWLWLASCTAYYLVYEWFHTIHHWPRESRIGRLWFCRLIRRHHTRHHDPRRMTAGNFNVSFPLADWALGTVLAPVPGKE